MQILLTTLRGQNNKIKPRTLPDGVGVLCQNVMPPEDGDAKPFNVPLAVSPSPSIPSGRQTLYRMGRDVASASSYWLSWTNRVNVIRGFDTTDPTERTYFTGDGAPKWTDNTIGLATAPYPTTANLLAVPQPTVAPTVTLGTNGATGDDLTSISFVYTWVNTIGWESAPSPATTAPAHRVGAILNLTMNGTVPAGSYNVNRTRWYKTQTDTDGNVEFKFLREVPIGTTATTDDARALGADVLPTDAANIRLPLPTDAHSLTQCWNSFAAAITGKTVRACETSLIYSWPLSGEYAFEDTPVALAAFSQRLVVLTTAGAHVMTGQDWDALDSKPLAVPPIVSARSLVSGDGWCAWASSDGMQYYGVDGHRNLTEMALTAAQWRAMSPSTMHAHFLQIGSKPYIILFYQDGSTWRGVIIDPSWPQGLYYLSAGYPAAYWDKLLRKLFVLNGATLMEWDAGATKMTARFVSQVFRQAHTDDSGEWLELISEGPVTTRVFTEAPATPEGALVQRMSRDLTIGVHTLPEAAIGRDWQLDLTWQGSIQGVSIT